MSSSWRYPHPFLSGTQRYLSAHLSFLLWLCLMGSFPTSLALTQLTPVCFPLKSPPVCWFLPLIGKDAPIITKFPLSPGLQHNHTTSLSDPLKIPSPCTFSLHVLYHLAVAPESTKLFMLTSYGSCLLPLLDLYSLRPFPFSYAQPDAIIHQPAPLLAFSLH